VKSGEALIAEARRDNPLIFRGYLISELEPELRLALLDRMRKVEPDVWQSLQNQAEMAGRDSPSRGSTAIRMLDVGLCGATPFLMMVSGGLDAHLLGRLDPALKARWGRAGIFAQGLAEWWRYRYPALAVSADGGPPVAAAFAAVCNIPYYGGRFALAPAARWDDRRLDLVLQPAAGRLPTLRFALALAGGGDLARAGIGAAPVGEAVIDGPPGACLQVDGDLCAEALPARVRLAAETLPVLVPETG
jgi:diacylglycerol kinase family enzyme